MRYEIGTPEKIVWFEEVEVERIIKETETREVTESVVTITLPTKDLKALIYDPTAKYADSEKRGAMRRLREACLEASLTL